PPLTGATPVETEVTRIDFVNTVQDTATVAEGSYAVTLNFCQLTSGMDAQALLDYLDTEMWAGSSLPDAKLDEFEERMEVAIDGDAI
ncbi:unnamed protein product, partial [Amoebophrya sp. A25]